ncbi:MAG: hypothetical protein KR126chlam6_01113 [Candidatus Anoxychlamydiales bacterium]|nr:hypothetical protein [Candidatus Anoxychlamydiales bacterium]
MDYKWIIDSVALPIIMLYFSKSRKFSFKEKHDAAKKILNAFQGFFQNVDTLKTHQSTNNKDQLLKFYKNSLKKHVDKNLKFFSNRKQKKIQKILLNDRLSIREDILTSVETILKRYK